MAATMSTSGPLFDGTAKKVLGEMATETAGLLGREGKRRWLAGLDATLRRPTGAYHDRITLYGPVTGQARVHDQRGIYGPWLEGTSSRNKTTRFKGYANARHAAQQLDRAATAVAEHVIAAHLGRLGG